jgi:hypothetical protein
MAGNTIRAELQKQQRVIEEQRIELQRQRREIDIQFRRTATVQAELDVLKAMVLRQGANLWPTMASPSNGNGHRIHQPPKTAKPSSKRDE